MKNQLAKKGYQIIEGIYQRGEIKGILSLLESKDLGDQFGIREFLVNNLDVRNCSE